MDLKKIKQVLDYGKDSIRTDPRLYILWREVYDKNFPENPFCGGCGDGFGSAFDFMLTSYNSISNKKIKKQMDPNSKFELKDDGVLMTDHGNFTNDNITDEVAIRLLQQSENYIKAFKRFPPNWKELVDETPTLVEELKGISKKGKKLEDKTEVKDSGEKKGNDKK